MHADAIATIVELERRCDTSAFTYNNVSYWPLARLRLWSALLTRLVFEKNAGADAIPNTGGVRPDAGDATMSVASVGPASLGLLQQAPGGVAPAFDAKKLRPDAAFFSRLEEHNDVVNGAAYAKISDSVYEAVAARYQPVKLEIADARAISYARTIPPVFMNLGLAGQNALFDDEGTLAHVDALLAAIKDVDAGIVLDTTALQADMVKIFGFARIYEKILGVLAPRALFHSVYYHPMGMAWMLACKWLGITTVDLQHGRLGPHHGCYTQLTAAPAGGYHLMPDIVWTWGPETKHHIDVDKNPQCAKHGGLVGGNAWMHRWRYGDTTGLEPPEAQSFAQTYAGTRKILVSLQPLDSPIGPELLKAMKDSPRNWLWLLRLHPLRRHTVAEVTALLQRAGVTNAEVAQSTSLPLFTLLKLAEHHVTVFSSVVVEAASFGVRSSVIGPEGQSIFADRIAARNCAYTPSAADIIAHTQACLNASFEMVHDTFIDMRPNVVGDAIDTILNHS